MNTLADVHLRAKWRRVPCPPGTTPTKCTLSIPFGVLQTSRSNDSECRQQLSLRKSCPRNQYTYRMRPRSFAPARSTRTGPLARSLFALAFQRANCRPQNGYKGRRRQKAAGERMQSTKCPNEQTNEGDLEAATSLETLLSDPRIKAGAGRALVTRSFG